MRGPFGIVENLLEGRSQIGFRILSNRLTTIGIRLNEWKGTARDIHP